MRVEFLHVGFDNVVAANRVVAIVGPSSAPVKRMVQEAIVRNVVIDMTNGRKTKAVIVLDSGHIALAALAAGDDCRAHAGAGRRQTQRRRARRRGGVAAVTVLADL